MSFLRRGILYFCLLAACGVAFAQAIGVPRHAMFTTMPLRSNSYTASTPMKVVSDTIEDYLPSSTGSYYYSVTAGNTYGPATKADKAGWLASCMNWINNQVPGLTGNSSRGTGQNENITEWIDSIVFPELTMRTEQMASFQRAMKAFQLFRQMQVMAKSFTGSLFKFDLLDILPVYEQVTLDDFGMPSNGVRVGLRYKDADSKNNLLAAFGLDSPHIGPYDTPRLVYKGPQSFSGLGLKIEATPYQGTDTGSGALRIGQAGNEILDRVFFEGMMGRNMANGGVYYTSRALQDRPSPVLLQQAAQSARDIRINQILNEADAYAKAYNIDPATALATFQDELNWWDARPQEIYDDQIRRLNRLRDEVQPAQNDIVKLESPEHLQEESDPARKTFLDGVYNLYSQIGDSVSEVYNAATGDENDLDNPGPRLLFKANVDYAKATHAAYLEALAIRRYLASKIQADAQRGAAEGFYNLWKDLEDRNRVVAKTEAQSGEYTTKANRVITLLGQIGLDVDAIHAGVQGGP